MAACRKARIDAFIRSRKDGYDTETGAIVQSVSNGQMQRLGLARAFLRDSEVFLLDEPTAALNTESETKILKTISDLKQEGKCILLITHKESTMHAADRIVEL